MRSLIHLKISEHKCSARQTNNVQASQTSVQCQDQISRSNIFLLFSMSTLYILKDLNNLKQFCTNHFNVQHDKLICSMQVSLTSIKGQGHSYIWLYYVTSQCVLKRWRDFYIVVMNVSWWDLAMRIFYTGLFKVSV